MPALPRDQWPVCLDPYGHKITGIFVGGCVRRGDGSHFRAKAHAHITGRGQTHPGWICVLSAKRLSDDMLMLHEAAHIIADCGHTDKWRKQLLAMGGTLDHIPGISKSYHKKTHGPRGKPVPFKTGVWTG